MRALRGVATGYMGARVDMMTEKAKQDREDEIRTAEESFQLRKQDDLLKGQLANKIATLVKTGELEADAIRKAKEDVTSELRTQLEFQGYTPQMLDLLESQNVLINRASYNLWAGDYDKIYPNQIHWWTNEGWQDEYIKKYTKGTAFDSGNVQTTLEDENNLSSNVAASQTSDIATTEGTAAGTAVTTEADAVGTTDTVGTIEADAVGTTDADATAKDIIIKGGVVETNEKWYDKYKTAPKPETVILRRSDVNSPYAGLLTAEGFQLSDLPEDGTEVIKLTLDNSTGRYTQSLVKIGDTFLENLKSTDIRDKNLIGAVIRTPGLFPNSAELYDDVTGINTNALASLDAENAIKYSDIMANVYLIDGIYKQANDPKMAGKVADMAIALYRAGDTTKIVNDINTLGANADIEDLGNVLLEGIRNITTILDPLPQRTNEEIQRYNIALETYLNKYKDDITAAKDKNPKYGIIIDKMLDSLVSIGKHDYWNYIDEASDRVTEGAFASEIVASEKELGPGEEEGIIMAGSEPIGGKLEEQTDKVLKNETKKTETKKEETKKTETTDVPTFVGGEGVGSEPWLFENGNFNPDWDASGLDTDTEFVFGSDFNRYIREKRKYEGKLKKEEGKQWFKNLFGKKEIKKYDIKKKKIR